MQRVDLEFLSQGVFTVIWQGKIKLNCYIQAFPSLCFGTDRNITILWATFWALRPWTHWLTLHKPCLSCVALFESQEHTVVVGVTVPSACEDYLMVGVVVTRKWLGLLGRGGLMPREGPCAEDVVVSKVFISWATRPRPAQIGGFPDVPASSEGAFRNVSNAPIFLLPDDPWAFGVSGECGPPLVGDVIPGTVLTVVLGEEVVASLRFVRPGLVLI